MPAADASDQTGDPPSYRPKRVRRSGPGPAAKRPAKRPGRWLERIVGIVLGLALGIGVIVVFVFEGSEDTIDAPRISAIDAGQPRQGPSLGSAPVPLIRVIDGKPPASGPVRVDFEQGRRARFFVDSNQRLGIEITGYGVSRTVGPGRTLVAFEAGKRGQYPIVVSSSKTDIAALRVTRP